nr:MAG TPA: hypothetical protein [Caudoviricetes sp.]
MDSSLIIFLIYILFFFLSLSNISSVPSVL